ncbi:MAG: PPC domain-containing protein [Planctomycetaceae bacterium]
MPFVICHLPSFVRIGLLFGLLLFSASAVFAQLPQAPQYADCRLDSVFPNGGQQGTTVTVTFRGQAYALNPPRGVIIDGPPGITVKEVKEGEKGTVVGTLEIAADAPPGRRWLRVLNDRSGLTNFAHFVVGRLPESLEVEPNNELAKAQTVTTPTVINGRIDPKADIDCVRFTGQAGQKMVAAIAAFSLDIHGQYKDYGIADFSLELLDAEGRTLAAAEDTLGFDPLIEHTLPRDGDYFVRVTMLNFGGYPDAVYRLTLGEVPYLIGTFPSGLRRDSETEIELFGPNIPPGTKRRVKADADLTFPQQYVALNEFPNSGLDMPLAVGDFPEQLEAEPNNDREHALPLSWPATVNARFAEPNDSDWYRVTLTAGQKVWFDVIAQRFTHSPVDTLLQVFDANGQMLAENDDDPHDPEYESFHNFRTTDSKLLFTAPSAGEFFVKLTEQSGLSGPRAVYRLSVSEAKADFHMRHFPDAVPIWGPGSTAAVLVKVDHLADFNADVECSIEGLPNGWKSSSAVSLGRQPERYYNNYQRKVFLTITAPADAAIATAVPFRIIGRAKRGEEKIEHRSWPLTLFYTSDIGFFRASQQTHAVIAKPQGPWLELAGVTELKLKPGGTGTIPIKVLGAAADLQAMPLVINLATNGVACGLVTPQNAPIKEGIAEVTLKIPAEMPIGTFSIVAAQTWGSDIRVGMPAPCTPPIKLVVEPAK